MSAKQSRRLQTTAAADEGSESDAWEGGQSAARRARLGQVIGEWRLTGVLGEGGMSVVYQATHQSSGQLAAIKLLQQGILSDSNQRRFQREARMLIELQHPNILKILDFGCDPRLGDFMVLELLQGMDLAQVISGFAPLPLGWLNEVTRQLCDALQATHEAGIIHRDLKPSNVFLVPGDPFPEVRLLDFGIAKVQLDQKSTQLTSTGAVIGTPAYISPEQLKVPVRLSPATDIYALGVILFVALTGKHPLGEGSKVELFVKILQDSPAALGSLRPEFQGTKLAELLASMMSKKATDRPESVELFWDAFDEACQEIEDPLDTPDREPAFDAMPHNTAEGQSTPDHGSHLHFVTEGAKVSAWETQEHSDALSKESVAPDGKELPTHEETGSQSQPPSRTEPREATKAPLEAPAPRPLARWLLGLAVVLAGLAGGAALWWKDETKATKAPGIATQKPSPPQRPPSASALQRTLTAARQALLKGDLSLATKRLLQATRHKQWPKSHAYPQLYLEISQAYQKQGQRYAARHFLGRYQKARKTVAKSIAQKRRALDEALSQEARRIALHLPTLKEHLELRRWLAGYLAYQRLKPKGLSTPGALLSMSEVLAPHFPRLAEALLQRLPLPLLSTGERRQLGGLRDRMGALQKQRRASTKRALDAAQKQLEKKQLRQALQSLPQALLPQAEPSHQRQLRRWLEPMFVRVPENGKLLWSWYVRQHAKLKANGLRLWLTHQAPTLPTAQVLQAQSKPLQALFTCARQLNGSRRAYQKLAFSRSQRLLGAAQRGWKRFVEGDRWQLARRYAALKQTLDAQDQHLRLVVMLSRRIDGAFYQARFEKLGPWRKELLALLEPKLTPQGRAALQRRLTSRRLQEEAAKGLLRRGQKAYQSKRWKQARRAFLGYLKRFPKAHQRPALQKQLKACRCVLRVRFWEVCTKADYPPHARIPKARP